MSDQCSTTLQDPQSGVPEALRQAVAPVMSQLAAAREVVTGVRIGPCKLAAEFLDIEAVRLRIAQEQGGRELPGQASLVERLRNLKPEERITYLVLETARRQAKCYVEIETSQLAGVLWLPADVKGVE